MDLLSYSALYRTSDYSMSSLKRHAEHLSPLVFASPSVQSVVPPLLDSDWLAD